MTPLAKRIIKDLRVGPSASDSIAERLNVTTAATTRELEKLETSNHVVSKPLLHKPRLTVWHLK